jgi:hypothetical protein
VGQVKISAISGLHILFGAKTGAAVLALSKVNEGAPPSIDPGV